jgi:trimethylamine:corrinoid methyltransferase-like protein
MNAPVRRRPGRGLRPEPAAPTDAFHLIHAGRRAGISMLDDGDIARIRARALDVLESHGVVIRHAQGRAAMLRAGAHEGADEDRVRLPRELVEQALRETPKSAVLCGKRPSRDLSLPRGDGGFVMRTGTGAHGYVDPETGAYRNLHLNDVPTMAAVANHLDQVGFIAHPFVHGVPELTSDIHGYAAMLAHTDKHCWIQPYNTENVEFLMKLTVLAAGGEAALRARPIASCIVCSFTPLEFKVMDTEAMIQSGRYGLPIHACSLPSAGGTAPVTCAGMVAMAAAEIVAMVTKAHVLAPGIPVIATPLMFTLDMRTGRALQSCVESLQSAAMAIEFMKRGLGLLAHSYGSGSDTPDVDAQSMAERTLIGQTVALAGADILGGVGQLECATVFSPVQAVLDNELGGMIRRFVARPEVSDEAMNWRELAAKPAGAHFLDSAHTLKNCRTQFAPQVFIRDNRDGYEASGRRTTLDAARELCLDLIKRPPLEGLPREDTVREMAAVVAAADRYILDPATAQRRSQSRV